MRWGIVENQAGGVVLVQWRIAVFRRELLFLVGGENPGVLVGADQIVVAGEEIRAVCQQLDRLVLPQCTIGRIGIGIEIRRQLLDVETCRQLSRVRIHAVILFEGDGYAVFAVSETGTAVTVPRRNTVSPNRLEEKMHARTKAASETTSETTPSWPEDIFNILQRFDVAQVPYVPDAGHSQLIERVLGASSMRAIPLTTEEEGVALLARAWAGGQPG